jgi:hypothetical protein
VRLASLGVAAISGQGSLVDLIGAVAWPTVGPGLATTPKTKGLPAERSAGRSGEQPGWF